MSQAKYLIVGSSHAGLAALEAIRSHDEKGSITVVSKDNTRPYSPTILPYVISGSKNTDNIDIRDFYYFEEHNASFKKGKSVVKVNPDQKFVQLDSGEDIEYENLLLATGANAAVPSFPGINETPYNVIRTLDDAQNLRNKINESKSAIVVGAGLIAMHTAETLAQAGLEVTVVVRRKVSLFAYFSSEAAKMIEQVFADNKVRIATGYGVSQLEPNNGGCTVTLESGEKLNADLLLMATGVRPRIDYLEGSGIQVDQGVLVDEWMQTNKPNVWAAGDVAQAPGFFSSEATVNATLPNASIQGRTAGMVMANHPGIKPFPGSIGVNTFHFFGNHAFTLGQGTINESKDDIEVNTSLLPSGLRYQKFVFQNNRLIGVSAINADLDPGILRELIQRQYDLSNDKTRFINAPKNTGRVLMTKNWR